MLLHAVVLTLLGVSCLRVSASSSVYDCNGQAPWPLTVEDNEVASQRFQNWMLAFQHRCPADPSGYFIPTAHNSGIGSAITISIINMFKAFKAGQVYRPTWKWLWSEVDPEKNCVSHIDAIDCFNIPLSYCSLNIPMPSSMRINFTDANLFIDRPVDICTMAKVSQKTIFWVLGQFLAYHMRMPESTQRVIDRRVEEIFPLVRPKKTKHNNDNNNDNKNKKNSHTDFSTSAIAKDFSSSLPRRLQASKNGLQCLTAAIHVRSGVPDGRRKPFSGKEHYEALMNMNNELKDTNQTICTVYVTGDHLEDSIFFEHYNEELRAKQTDNNKNMIPAIQVTIGPFLFKTLPRFLPAPGEIEFQVATIKKTQTVTMQYIYTEYICDLALFTKADIFIGSHSNLFALTAPLRAAHHPEVMNNRTCFLDSRYSPAPLRCMGSSESVKFFSGAFGGFNGGSIFF